MDEPRPWESLAKRLQETSARLNAARVFVEPSPSSRVPGLGLLLNWMRRWCNRLFVRWYVAPQMEQQACFAQEAVAAFDDLASLLVEQAQLLERKREEAAEGQRPQEPPGSDIPAVHRLPSPEETCKYLASLPPEALRAIEDADLPPLETGCEGGRAKWYDEENALSFPMLWFNQLNGWHELFHLAILGVALNCRPGDLVLDLAGASGWVSEFLARFGLRTVLLDCVEDLLHTSRVRFGMDRRLAKCPPNHPVVGDALKLPFADESFDGVVCTNALHHMPSYEATLHELFRVLRPGGRAVFAEPGEAHARGPTSQLAMREYGFVEKNVPLPLVYVYARRVGFAHMWRYPYLHPEVMECSYPKQGAAPEAVLEHMARFLPDWLRGLSLFALEKGGRRAPTSHLSPWEQSHHRLAAELELLEHREWLPQDGSFVAQVRARNSGDVIWLAQACAPYGGRVQLGVKLCDPAGRLLRDDLARGALPRDICPGEDVVLEVTVPAPPPGRYVLRYDLLIEGVAWFELLGSSALEHPLEVGELPPPEEGSGR